MTITEVELKPIQKNDFSLVQTSLRLFSDIFKYQYLIKLLIQREFKASYMESLLGIVWKLITPLLPLGVYLVLQSVGLLHGSLAMPKIVYLICGLSFWHLFASTALVIAGRLVDQASTLKKIKIPFVVLYISALGQILFDFLVRFSLLALVVLYFRIVPSFSWLWLIVVMLSLLSLGFAFGILTSLFVVYAKDFKNALQIFLQYFVFLSSVLFPVPENPIFKSFVMYNPLHYLIESARSMIYFSELVYVEQTLCILLVSIASLLLLVQKIYQVERYLIKGL